MCICHPSSHTLVSLKNIKCNKKFNFNTVLLGGVFTPRPFDIYRKIVVMLS